MNKIIELQRKSGQLTSDVEDILHAGSLNFQALISEAAHPTIDCLGEEFTYLAGMLTTVQKLVTSRAPHFMNYLITRQIQQEETRVRRERLNEYEDKIYDQKRIITDKQTFFENLLRPKRKRPSYQTPEEFQEVRAREREQQEKVKFQQLSRDISDLQTLRRLLQNNNIRKKIDLEHTKSSSISQVNVSLVGQETITERVIPLDDRTNKEHRRPTHVRSCSMQHELVNSTLMKEQSEEDAVNAKIMLSQISKLAKANQQLHKIYDQSTLSLKFKKNQNIKIKQLYTTKVQTLKETRKIAKDIELKEQWRKNRVFRPEESSVKRSGSK